jgi:hypothetical protein
MISKPIPTNDLVFYTNESLDTQAAIAEIKRIAVQIETLALSVKPDERMQMTIGLTPAYLLYVGTTIHKLLSILQKSVQSLQTSVSEPLIGVDKR